MANDFVTPTVTEYARAAGQGYLKGLREGPALFFMPIMVLWVMAARAASHLLRVAEQAAEKLKNSPS